MARRRRRNHGFRSCASPSGRLSRAGEQEEISPALVRRLRDQALNSVKDPEWGTELGRMFLFGKIEAPLYAAGKRWAGLAANYYRAIGAPFSGCTVGPVTAGGPWPRA